MSSILGDPATHAYTVTPSDSANLPQNATALLLSNFGAGAASIVITAAGGEKSTIALGTPGIAALPYLLPIQTVKVWATGTSGVGTITALFQ
jgi:hypothetical protein